MASKQAKRYRHTVRKARSMIILGDSSKYDQDEDEGFVTATGSDTEGTSQVSGQGGGQNRQ